MTRRLGVAVLVGLLPWTVLLIEGSGAPTIELVFAWGLITTSSFQWVSLYSYLFEFTMGLPDRLLAWPIATLLYSIGTASVLAGATVGREDRRMTAGAFVLAGLSVLVFTLGIARRNPTVTVAVPAGAILLWLAGWWTWTRP